MQGKIKVAFIGAGYMAKEHIKAFADIKEIELAGIFSRTRSKAEILAAEYGIATVCNSVAELYEVTKADLVIVSVPVLAVLDTCLEVFQHPWIALIEKPAGHNVSEAELLAGHAEREGRQAYVALNRRHYSSTTAVIKELDSVTGTRLVNVYDQEDLIAARNGGHPEVVLENWMYANAIHVVDYLNVFCRGAVISVEPIIRWTPEQPQFVAAKVIFSSGDIGLYQAIWNGPGPWAVTVTTQEKRCEMRPLEQATLQLNGSRKQEILPKTDWDTDFKPGLRAQAEEATKAVKGEDHLLPTLADAMKSMQLVKKIYA